VRFALKACAVLGVLSACCLLAASSGWTPSPVPYIPARSGPSGVEFVGVYEDRSELIPGLRSAATVHDLAKLLHESNKPGGTNIRAQFIVVNVLSDGKGCLKPGDRVCLIFGSPKGPRDPSPLPDRLVGRTLHVRLHDRFNTRYRGRFTYAEWRGADGSAVSSRRSR
jgi:hypothetical protein